MLELLHKSSIDLNTLKAHSGRAAASFKAAFIGLSLSASERAAEWSNFRTFATFLKKPIDKDNFVSYLLSS